MSIGADGTIFIPLTGGTTFFEGEPCDSTPDPNNPGYTHPVNFANDSQGSFTDTRTLYLMAVKPDGSYTVQTIDGQTFSGPGWDGAPQYDVFLHRGVPDGQGGFILPIEQILYHTGGTNVSLPFSVLGFEPDLALGSDGTAYISARGVLGAVNSGAFSWTYQPQQGNLDISSVLEGGGIAVSNDQLGPFLLDTSGNPTSAGFPGPDVSLSSSWQDQWYALNVAGTNGGVSLLAFPALPDVASIWPDSEANPASQHAGSPISFRVNFTGNKTAGDNLSFVGADNECVKSVNGQEKLGLVDCTHASGYWLWNLEGNARVFDDASNWTVAVSTEDHYTGMYVGAQGELQPFSGGDALSPDGPNTEFLQQPAGQKSIFYIDGPGPKDQTEGGPIYSLTDVLNFRVVFTNSATHISRTFYYHVKFVVNSGRLDRVNSEASYGNIPLNF